MFILKLSRRLLILAVLCGGLAFVFGENPAPVKALEPKCCWECLSPGCQVACNAFPTGLICQNCLEEAQDCFVTCDPDPLCAH